MRRFWMAPLLAAAMLAACGTTGERPVDDAVVAANVRAVLRGDPSLRAYPIAVESRNDVVQLSGTVHTPEETDHAQELAVNVPGVRTVHNRLVVR